MANDMEIFAKFSASGYENPKLMELALKFPSAYRVWTWAIMYSVRNLTDGFIPSIIASTTLAARKKDLAVLEELRFFEPVDGGWIIHDFLEAQGRSRADVEANRSKKVENARKAAEARWGKTQSSDVSSNANDMQDACATQCDSDAPRMQDGMRQQCDSDAERCPDTDTDTDTDIIYSPPTPSRAVATKPDVERVMREVAGFYPSNRFDGAKGSVRFDLEAQWPKIVKASGGAADAESWFIERARAYVAAQDDERYVKKFSRFLGAEDYATAWKPAQPKQAPPSKQMLNRQHNWQVAVSLMTDEEKRKYGVTEVAHDQPV